MKKLRILFAGGSTGGHIYPLIAVAERVEAHAQSFGITADMRYFGNAYAYAQELVERNIDFVPIISSKLRRYWSFQNIIDIIKFPFSILQLLWKMLWFMPDVIFSKGGPGTFAVILVGRFYRIPVVLHESDSIPGASNKISERFAKKVFLAFANAGQYFKNQDKLEVVGHPVRASLFQQAEQLSQRGEDARAVAKKSFGLDPREPAVFITGGSQGAEKLNYFVLENLEIFIREFQIIHQVGTKNYESYKKEYEFTSKEWSEVEKNRYSMHASLQKEMADALVAADVVIARAGSGSIFELAAFGKPALLIPLPNSAQDHQKKNAYLYAETGAAIVIQQENLLGNLVMEEVKKLIQNPEQLQRMAGAAQSFYRPDSADIMAKYLLTYVK